MDFMIFWTQTSNSINFALTFESQETPKSNDKYLIQENWKQVGQASNVHLVKLTSELWSPYTCKQKLLLENVQHRATKFILNCLKDN